MLNAAIPIYNNILRIYHLQSSRVCIYYVGNQISTTSPAISFVLKNNEPYHVVGVFV